MKSTIKRYHSDSRHIITHNLSKKYDLSLRAMENIYDFYFPGIKANNVKCIILKEIQVEKIIHKHRLLDHRKLYEY